MVMRTFQQVPDQEDLREKLRRDLARIRGQEVAPQEEDLRARLRRDLAAIRGQPPAPPPVSVPMEASRSSLLNRSIAQQAFAPEPVAAVAPTLVPKPYGGMPFEIRGRRTIGTDLPPPVPVNQFTMEPTEPLRRGLRPPPSLLAQPDAAAWAIPEPVPPEGVTAKAHEALLQRPDEAGWVPPPGPRESGQLPADIRSVLKYGVAAAMPGKLGEKWQERILEEAPPYMLAGEGPDVYALAEAAGRVAGFIPQAAIAGAAFARPVGALASKVMGAVISPEGRTLATKAGGRVISAIARLAQKFGIPDLVERAALLAPKTTAAATGAATAVAPALAFGAGMETIGAVGDIAAGDEPVEAAAAHIRAFVQAAPMYGGLGVLLGGLGGAATMQRFEKGLGEPRKNALDVLGLRYNATTEQIHARRRDLSKALHPDLGGKTEDMQVVNAAADVALKGAASAPTIEAEVGVSQMHTQPSTQPNIRHEAARRGAPVPEPVVPVRAAKPAGFTAEVERLRGERDARQVAVRAQVGPEGGAVDFGGGETRVISRNPDAASAQEYPWRVTTMVNGQPTGHTVHRMLDDTEGGPKVYADGAIQEVAASLAGRPQAPTAPIEAVAPEAAPAVGIRRRIADLVDPARRVEAEATKAELSEAYRDPMTGLPNPSAFVKASARWDKDPERHLLALDMPFFKKVNDELGREAGDKRLAEVASITQEEAARFGVDARDVMRAGGDEFAASAVGPDAPARLEAFGQALE